MKPFLIPKTFDLSRFKTSDGKYFFTSDNLAFYVQTANPSVPNTTGLGVLSEAIYCKVVHGPNGYDELEMEYPANGRLYSEIVHRALIVAKVERTRGFQAYRIYKIVKQINEHIKVYARHIAYDLSGIVVKPFSADNLADTLVKLKSSAMTNCPFTFSSTRTMNIPFKVKKPASIWSLMGSGEDGLQGVYNGEYLFDNYSISFEDHLGEDNGVQVSYGVNMTDFEQDAACDECYTGVVGYWEEDDEVVYSNLINPTGQFDYVRILTVDMSTYWDDKPTVSELDSAVRTYISANNIGVPKVSWTINFVPLDMTEEYRDMALIQQVSLGDTVYVNFEKLGVKATARVIEIEWDVLLDRYSSVSLGDVKKNIAKTMANYGVLMNNVPTKKQAAKVSKAIAKTVSDAIAKALIGTNGGAVRLLDTNGDDYPDTLYIADNPDPAQATKVWRFNYRGWGASSNGYNGPFVLGATLEDGLLANFVTAAHLTAGTIQSADGTTFNLDLDNGVLSIAGYATKAAANANTQLVYISKASGTASVNAPSSWVTNSTGNQNTWTIKRPQYSASYPVLFVATQSKAVDGTVTCTTPQIDNTTTVIDGSSITTGYISANRIYGGQLTLGGNNNENGKLVINNMNGQPIAESDWMGISFYSGLSQADKSIFYRISRIGFTVQAGDAEGHTGGVFSITGGYDSSSQKGYASIGLSTYNAQTGSVSPSIVIDGLDSSIKCNSHNIVWTDLGTSISSGANILTLDPGRYFCTSNSVAASLTNCPTSKNFALFIYDRNTSSNRKNYMLHDVDNNIYINAQTGNSTWTGWKKITTTSA